MQGLFITATDTGVGKTEITAGIARMWRREGRSFAVCKPVATGAARRHAPPRAAAGEADLDAVTPLVFAEPAAPPVAARLEGRTLALGELSAAVERRKEQAEAVLVEGVGGLLCPLTETETVADLVARWTSGVVVVARRGLGTLNHTLLTLEVAQRRGLRCGESSSTRPPRQRAGGADQRRGTGAPARGARPGRCPLPGGGYEGEIPAPGRGGLVVLDRVEGYNGVMVLLVDGRHAGRPEGGGEQMQTVNFRCGHCNNLMAVGPEFLGQQVRCPHCQNVVVAPTARPGPAPAPAPPPAPSRRSMFPA